MAAHGLDLVKRAAAAVTSVCMADVDVAAVVKVSQTNWQACRIWTSSHLFYDCIRN